MSILAGHVDPAARAEVRVCDSLACEMMGAQALLAALRREVAPAVRVMRARCMGRCDKAPVAAIGRRHAERANVAAVVACVRANLFEPLIPSSIPFEDYERDGGYHLYRRCLAGECLPDEVITAIGASGLRRLGGDGLPIEREWRRARDRPAPRLVVVNAGETEPGNFKDRVMFERDPHRVLEGALIAAWAVGATAIFVAVHDEYAALHAILGQEIAVIEAAGLLATTRLHLRRVAGGYLCGEETALIACLEDQGVRPAQSALVHNVESLAWVRDILERGGAWFAGQGRHGAKGLRAFSVSGRVTEPGLKLAPAGITLRELLEAYCEGMAEGHRLRAFLVGGARGRFLPASAAELPLDDDGLRAAGATIGTGAIVVLSDRDDLDAAACNLSRFIESEAAGIG